MVYVCIKPGWAEGNWHTQNLRAAVEASGFQIVDYASADAVIAHSTACYDLPPKTPARYFILVDPPYWPGKSLWKRVYQKKRLDSKLLSQQFGGGYVLKKTVWELIYIFSNPRYIQLAYKNHDKLDFLDKLKGKHILIVRNSKDTFSAPTINVALASYKNVYYQTFPGTHDDLYLNPQTYIDLLPKTI